VIHKDGVDLMLTSDSRRKYCAAKDFVNCDGPRRCRGTHAWRIRIETLMRLSCTRNEFLLQGGLRAWEGANEVCRRKFALLLAIACDDPRNASGRRYD